MGRFSAAVLGTLGCALLFGCSWTFDDEAPDVPLLGDPVLPDRFPKLNIEPASGIILMSDSLGNPWVAMPVAAPLIPPLHPTQTLRLLRLDADAPTDGRERKVLSADHLYAYSHYVYLVDPPANTDKAPIPPTHVTAVPIGIGESAQMFTFPTGAEFFSSSSGTDQAFVYWVPKATDPRVFVSRTDGSYQRALPPPKGFDSDATSSKVRIFLNRSGDRLFMQDADRHMTVYATTSEASVDLGVQPTTYLFDGDQSHLVFCADSGLTLAAVDGSGQAVLDQEECDTDILRVSAGAVYYKSRGAMRKVPIDGSSPPEAVVAAPVGQLLALGPQAAILYSLDSPLTYGPGIGDGWLGDWKFMNRGRGPRFSADGKRLRWLENGARSDGSGDLDSATVADRAVLHIARNVRSFAELDDGRLLAISNAAFKGTQDRLIAIDEASHTARWVVDSAHDFAFISGTQDLLVTIVVGQVGYDIRRVPIPPKPAP
jgi:hypothetical protein